jgi:opacity protein-like surface antigen
LVKRICTVAVIAAVFLSGAAVADEIELVTGEKIEGAILENNDQRVVIEHPVLGRLEIDPDQIKPPEEVHVTPGLFGTSFLEGWTRGASIGWNLSTGKSKNQNLNGDLGLHRETERHRMKLVSKYYYSESDKEVEDNQFDARYTHDFLFADGKWFPFLSPNYRYDSQQDWNHRAGVDVGIGYQFFKNEEWDLLGRLGGGVSQTLKDDREETTSGVPAGESPRHRGDNPIRTEWTGLIVLQGTWFYMEGQSLAASIGLEPDFADLRSRNETSTRTPNFRSIMNAEWKVAIGAIEGLSFKTGINYIHDSHESNRNRNDRKYYLNLAYDF